MTKEFSQSLIVNEKQTAKHLGSGLLPVFSTPSMVAFMENTAMQMIEIPDGGSSVGTSIEVKHLKASAVGEKLICHAQLIYVDNRKYTFDLTVSDSKGEIVGTGKHERVVIDVERFMSKLK